MLLIILLKEFTTYGNVNICKYGHDNKRCEICGIKDKDCKCCLEYKSVKNDLIE